MKAFIITFLAICFYTGASAQDAGKAKELDQRVQTLEDRIAELEKKGANDPAKKMQKVARQYAEAERGKFKPEDIAAAEKMYFRASDMMRRNEPESKKVLDSVVSLYPKLNRAGCAQLYRAQQEADKEKERLLKDCIARYSGCYYMDGAQVGPLAMIQLAYHYRETGRKEDAQKLFDQIRKEYPEAVSHRGGLLVDELL